MTCRCVAPVDVAIYRDPTTPEGREVRQYFDRKGVQFDDYDVTGNPAALEDMRAMSGQTDRPVIVVDDRVLVGFDPEVLDPLVPSRF